MFAVIEIRCHHKIDEKRLISGLAASSDIATAFAKTRLAMSPELVAATCYALIQPGSVFVAFCNQNSLQVHVENTLGAASLPKLKAAVESALEVFRQAADNCGYKIERIAVSIHAEDNLILIGRDIESKARLYERLRETVLGTCLLGVGTGLAGWLFERRIEAAGVAALAASLLFVIWESLGVWLGRKDIEYADA